MSEKVNELTKNRGLFKLYESFTSDEEYNASRCLSYSILKNLHDNPKVLIEEKVEEEKEWFTFGTLVDVMLTSTTEELNKKIFVNDKVPSEQFKNIAEYIVANNITDITEATVENIYEKSGSAVNWLPTTKLKRLKEECTSYIVLLTEHKGKIIVSTELMLEATKIAEVLRTHSWTKHLFLSEKDQIADNIEILYQYKIKYIYDGIQCKSKLDIIIVDHDQQVIYPFDLKTGHDPFRVFANHALYKYKYGYQGVLYKEGLDKFIKSHTEFEGYDVDNFKFIYISRQSPTFPIILEMTERCHVEFRDIGVKNLMYDIPPIGDLMEEAEYYISLINEDKIPDLPYSLIHDSGLIRTEGITKPYELIY